MESGKALQSGKSAEKRKCEAMRRDLLVLTHQFLFEEGLYEAADAMEAQLKSLLSQFKAADNMDLPMILADFIAYYRIRFHKEPTLSTKKPENAHHSAATKTHSNRGPSKVRKGKEVEELVDSSNFTLSKSLTLPRPISEEDKDLFSLIGREVLQPSEDSISFQDVVGLTDAKEALEDAFLLPMRHPDVYKSLPKINAILLTGPPGTGKTMLASALRGECKSFTFFNIHSSSLASKWRGDSEKLIRSLFEVAFLNAPSVIFIDEIEAILSERGGQGEHEASKRAKAEFLIYMDGIQSKNSTEQPVLLLASTNLPWTLDPAFMRRFQKIINIPLPTKAQRLDIFKACLKHQDSSGLDIQVLAEKTEGFSGSDIKRSCTNAIHKLLRRRLAKASARNAQVLTMQDVIGNLQKTKLNN